MQISPVQNINNFNYRQQSQPNFTGGAASAATVAGEAVARSRFFEPVHKMHGKLVD